MQPQLFPSRLKSARQLKGLSLRDLVRLLDKKISRQSISQYENGVMQTEEQIALFSKMDFQKGLSEQDKGLLMLAFEQKAMVLTGDN